MWLEPIIAFLLLRYLKKILKDSPELPKWEKKLNTGIFLIIALVILQVTLPVESITAWIWHALVIFIILNIYREKDFNRARNAMFAVVPLVAVSLLGDILKLFPSTLYEKYNGYLDFAVPFAMIWLVGMLIQNNKQQKALDKEKKKTHEEEEQKRIVSARKAELEVLVAERTSEITKQKEELEDALTELRATQSQLIQSEKMASLGELTAGIAHEIQNPLNFVNNFSEVNMELSNELKEELHKIKIPENDKVFLEELLNDIVLNEEKINHHGKRADAIVKGMLQHSRKSTGQKEPTDINALADEYLRLSYHGLRAKDKTFNASFKTDFDDNIGNINIIPQDVGRVLLNLINNAFYAVTEKKKDQPPAPLPGMQVYEPAVSVSTRKINDLVEITVRDNGGGVPQNVLDKIFQPFFTTKPTGQGTGLGLSLSYEIIKAHGGEINVETKEGEGTAFIIQLPIQ